MVANLHFEGVLRGFEDSIGHRLINKYDKVALGALLSFWWLAYKCYKKDKNRFW